MPETWIKLRDDLDTDPRVARMAALLATTAVTYVLPAEVRDLFGTVTRAVTRNAMRDITLAGLSRVWSHANRHTQDGIFRHVELDYLDDLSRIPGFGRAMQAVGWAIHHPESDSIILPNFTEHNAPDKNGARSQTAAARRQQRYREAQKARSPIPSDPPVIDVNNSTPDRTAVTSPITPEGVTQSVTSDVTRDVTPSISSSSSSSISSSDPSEPERESRGKTPIHQLVELDRMKRLVDSIVPEWEQTRRWGSEDEHRLLESLPSLATLTEEQWGILRWYWKWIDSSANQSQAKPEVVTAKKSVFLDDPGSYLKRATTTWKACKKPPLKKSPRLQVSPSKPPPPPEPPPTPGASAFMAALKAYATPTVATNPVAA